ncbi:MAG TPA: Rieske 2Fe-2S domain-containing protein [Stellaceae bacterium]|jgi:phenylpropionate dioxygenase-like ring-hydroxylating dioxygenase large terminal subunit|nr:Rieske 2Fe-2S domain-containing protein [Stellaceae bacterium]
MLDEPSFDQRNSWELLTRTGKNTPGGALLRRYWQPVFISADLPPGSAPQPIKLLGEDLVLFRDEQNRPGLLGRKCAHRCVDLSYGRLENGGLRCVYHGWLYDVNGRCLEQPGEPDGGVATRDRVQQLSYPCLERGGAIWTYLGPGAAPLFPDYAALTAPDEYRIAWRWRVRCNYLQGNEGNIDPIHTSYLHRFELDKDTSNLRNSISVFQVDGAPKLAIQNTRFGLRVFTERRMPQGDRKILRVTNLVMPNACAIGGYEAGLGRGGCSMFWHVPIDDTQHWRYEFIFHSKKKLPRSDMLAGAAAEVGPDGAFKRNRENRYLQNRDEMDTSFIGMGRNFLIHDTFVTESQGDIHDHRDEHLANSDIAIVRGRRLLLEAMRDIAAGKDPLGVIRAETQNDYADLVVLTEELDAAADNEAFCDTMTKERIYTLAQPLR